MQDLAGIVQRYSQTISTILSDGGSLGRLQRRQRYADALESGAPVTAPIEEPNLMPLGVRKTSGSPTSAGEVLNDLAAVYSRLPSGIPGQGQPGADMGAIYSQRANRQSADALAENENEIKRAAMVNQRYGQQEAQVNQGNQAMANAAIEATMGEAKLAEGARQADQVDETNQQANEIALAKVIQKGVESGNKPMTALMKAINDYVPNPEYRVRVAAVTMEHAKQVGMIDESGRFVGDIGSIPSIVQEASKAVLSGQEAAPGEPALPATEGAITGGVPVPDGAVTQAVPEEGQPDWSKLADPRNSPETWSDPVTDASGKTTQRSSYGQVRVLEPGRYARNAEQNQEQLDDEARQDARNRSGAVFNDQLADDNRTTLRTLSPEEKEARGFPKNTVVQEDSNGGLVVSMVPQFQKTVQLLKSK